MAAGISKSFSGYAEKNVGGHGNFKLYIQFSMAETYDTATRKSDLLFSNFQIKAVDDKANNTSFVGGSITVTVNGTAYTVFSAAASAGTYKVPANGSYNTVLVNSTGAAWSYTLSGLSRGNDGKLSVEVSWNGITLNNWYSGFGITVSGTETVTLTTVVASYTLSINAGTGSTISVSRTSSPNQGAFTGSLSIGDTIYYGDVLTITFGASTGYDLVDHTVNGSSFTSGGTHTVSDNVFIVTTATRISYTLTLTTDGHCVLTVTRSGSALASGDTIYYGDSLNISFSALTGYEVESAVLNGDEITSPYTHNVTGSVDITIVTALLSSAWIYVNGSFKRYFINIYIQGAWRRCREKIFPGGGTGQQAICGQVLCGTIKCGGDT